MFVVFDINIDLHVFVVVGSDSNALATKVAAKKAAQAAAEEKAKKEAEKEAKRIARMKRLEESGGGHAHC